MFKKMISILVVLVAISQANAVLINGQNFADSVESWSGSVQNYAGTMMDSSTTNWLIGVSDSVEAGWRSSGQVSITIYFEQGINDLAGDDLEIVLFSGGKAGGSVWVSSDNVNFIEVGYLSGGKPMQFRNETFDFAGAADNVHYVKVNRETFGSGSGMFFDSFAAVPEPATAALLIMSLPILLKKKK